MAEGEIAALKEVICSQYLIMKNLHAELEKERESSATAATEALSMILRLQREKATEKMEACQYRRIAEERIQHAEESLEMLKNVVQYNNLDIESLEIQLKACKSKLANLGIIVPDLGSCKSCFNGVFKRNASLPLLHSDDFTDKKFINGLSSNMDDGNGLPESIYQDEKVSKKVKELAHGQNFAIDSFFTVISSELQSASSSNGSLRSCFSASVDSTKRGKINASDNEDIVSSPSRYEENDNLGILGKQISRKVLHSACFHDIFEVPQSHKGCKPVDSCNKLLQNTVLETNSMIKIPNMVPNGAENYIYKYDELLNKALVDDLNGVQLSKPVQRNDTSVNYQRALMDPNIEHLRTRVHQLEDERDVMQNYSERGKEQMKVLREILKQLNTIESHIKRPATHRKSSPAYESSFVSLMEMILM